MLGKVLEDGGGREGQKVFVATLVFEIRMINKWEETERSIKMEN
jgi:hypothetical protein